MAACEDGNIRAWDLRKYFNWYLLCIILQITYFTYCKLNINTLNQIYIIKKNMQRNYDYIFKIIIVGSSAVGKTSILLRFADDSF